MASNNNNENAILQLFADNVVGNITAETLRTFISTVFQDSEVRINKFTTLASFEAQPNPTIYEGSLISIYGSTVDENGMYISSLNQPQDRQYLTQISSAGKAREMTKSTYEFTASDNQTVITGVSYSDNLVDVFVEGEKMRDALITKNSALDTLGTNLILSTGLILNSTVEVVCYVKG